MSTPDARPESTGPQLFLALLGLAMFLVIVAGAAGRFDAPTADAPTADAPSASTTTAATATDVPPARPAARPAAPQPARLPHGGTQVFDGRMLVAYYGTAGTGVLGVLGETGPDEAMKRLTQAAAPFARGDKKAQPVFELIVSVADAYPGPDGDFSHDIARSKVQPWVDAAQRHGALLVLDLQTGRSDFLTVAKRWEWALRHPWVGLALDPEWRMRPGEVPGRRIGSVGAAEVNRTSAWLEELVVKHDLPQKVFMLHQFRTSMLPDAAAIVSRPHLATVQHVDGFGTPREKLATYRVVARPGAFKLGFKLFYDEDRPRLDARQVMAIDPRVDFVSFQ